MTNAIGSIAEFIDVLSARLALKETHDYVYRGQADSRWPVSSSAARRLHLGSPHYVSVNEFKSYHRGLLQQYRARQLDRGADGRTLSDLELLGEIQHYEGATGLVDFTMNAAVALWFACGEPCDHDGQVYVLDMTLHADEIAPVSPEYIEDSIDILLEFTRHRSQGLDPATGPLRNDATCPKSLWHWVPAMTSNQRVFAQHSCFLFGTPVLHAKYFASFGIKKEAKASIRKEIQALLDLSHSRVFSDFAGYSRYCHHASVNICFGELLQEGFAEAMAYYRNEAYLEAIERFSAMIDSSDSEGEKARYLLYRGKCYRCLPNAEDYREHARSDFDAIINGTDIAPDLRAEAFGNRGAMYHREYKGTSEKAIADFSTIIEMAGVADSHIAMSYFYRGMAKQDLFTDEPEKPLADYAAAIEMAEKDEDVLPMEQLARAYVNRGICWSQIPGERQKARNDFEKVKSLRGIPDSIVRAAEDRLEALETRESEEE